MTFSFFLIAPPFRILAFIPYLFGTICLAAIDTGAFAGRQIPAIGANEVVGPERPVPALARSDGVNRTGLALLAPAQEYTVASMSIFNDSPAKTHPPQKFMFQLPDRDIEMLRN